MQVKLVNYLCMYLNVNVCNIQSIINVISNIYYILYYFIILLFIIIIIIYYIILHYITFIITNFGGIPELLGLMETNSQTP